MSASLVAYYVTLEDLSYIISHVIFVSNCHKKQASILVG